MDTKRTGNGNTCREHLSELFQEMNSHSQQIHGSQAKQPTQTDCREPRRERTASAHRGRREPKGSPRCASRLSRSAAHTSSRTRFTYFYRMRENETSSDCQNSFYLMYISLEGMFPYTYKCMCKCAHTCIDIYQAEQYI